MASGICVLVMGAAMQVGAPSPSEAPNFPPLQNAYNQYGFEGQYEQRYPVDSQQNWVHGYRQEIPAYGGHAVFRPYNYKDILSQSQVAAGWGESPVLPYSQQFWHKYNDQATMLKLSRNEGLLPQAPPPSFGDPKPVISPMARRSARGGPVIEASQQTPIVESRPRANTIPVDLDSRPTDGPLLPGPALTSPVDEAIAPE